MNLTSPTPWQWWVRLPEWAKTISVLVSFLGAAFALGLASASAFSQQMDLPAQVRAATAMAERNQARIEVLESAGDEFRRFAGCLLIENAENRDISACRYILTDPGDYKPPDRE